MMKNQKKSIFILGITIVCVTLLFRCAYLNTLYNAKVSFNKAFKAHQKLIKKSADTTDQLPAEIKEGYDKTIAKCAKTISVYPKRKKWHDDALFLKAKATYYKKEYSLAIQRARQLIKEFPESPFIPETYLLLGKAYLGYDNLQKAEETFYYILEKYPKLNTAEDITLLLAEVAMKREGKSQAIQILKESLESVTSDEKKMDIIIKLGGLYIDMQMYEEAVQLIATAPRNKDFPTFLYKMDYQLIICHKELAQYEQAMTLINIALKINDYVAYKSNILLEKGIIQKLTDQIKLAIETLEEITKGTGDPEIQAKAWLELASIYQFEYGDFEKAKECYEKAQSTSNDEEIQRIADKRISGMHLRDEYLDLIKNSSIQKDTADSSESLFSLYYKLGEVYWLNLDEPDSALNQYNRITTDSSADSSLLEKSLYARAWILRFIKEDTTTSDSLYKKIIKKYPQSITAQKSQQDLGIPVTVKTYEDSARLALIQAERLYFDEQEIVKAVNAYYKVAKKYPDLEDIAIKSLYMAGWLCDNVLNKNRKALTIYKKLCDKYPESDICINEIQPRLKIVEDTLKVLKQKKKQKKKKRKILKKGTIKTPSPTDSVNTSDEAILSEEEPDSKKDIEQPPTEEASKKDAQNNEESTIDQGE